MNNQFDPITQFLNQLKTRFNWKNQTMVLMAVAVIAVLWVFFTGLYTVGVDEVAVIQRFGRYVRQSGPGLHFKLPDGIEKRTNVKVRKVFSSEFGQRTVEAGVNTKFAPESQFLDESLMLTGDLNCALVSWVIQFRITDPVKYLFKVRDVNGTLRCISEATMREVIGDRSINEILTKRREIADTAVIYLQTALDDAEVGLSISTIELQNTNVPGPVQPSFNEVNQAVQEKKETILKAREERNKVIPSARGEAEKTIRQAEGYALEKINMAKGDSSRFVSIYKEYARAKNVTRRRLYLETMGEILPKIGNKYIIDSDQKGILPLLNLEKK